MSVFDIDSLIEYEADADYTNVEHIIDVFSLNDDSEEINNAYENHKEEDRNKFNSLGGEEEFLIEYSLSQSAETIESSPPDGKTIIEPDGPKRFVLYDNLIAEIVDYDATDNSPIVEFSICPSDIEDELPYECGICPDVMEKKKLEEHVKTHIKKGTKRFSCIYCSEDFVSRTYAAGHARRHMGIRPYVCIPCKLYYCTKPDLRVHQQRRHWSKDYVCEQCGKSFAQSTTLKTHLQIHEQTRRFECEHCGKRFLRNYVMKEHVRNIHLGDRRLLRCPFCEMTFKDTHKLAQHRKDMHLNQAQFECRACGLEFKNIDFFDAHRRSLQCRKEYELNNENVQQDEVIDPKSD